ncbi:hypothetical protein HanXRQr2_Chr05g0234781 [Helianthus annuus]|uniref:Uncharacterized protein n=1 Tax=Helianthus annuus TaxID=4232 RepID=A0A9K3J263_HELAN|nr:hypothetical protein HanXRQr2_Chr05g0234781 [Helianthus annuus]KAJ0924295.1 hypothetical protein HanPSC8_Chr05g0226571 [Helianthus annuus]
MWANGVEAPIDSLIRLLVVELSHILCNHVAPNRRTLYLTILEIVCKVLEDRTRQSLRLCAI